MPRIGNLIRWLYMRVRRDGSALFKIIHRNFYSDRGWSNAITAIVHLTKCNDKNVVILVLHGHKSEFPFELKGDVMVKEFASLAGVVNFIEGWFRKDAYVYYYPKKKVV